MRRTFNIIIVFVSGTTATRTPCLDLEKSMVLESCWESEERTEGDKASDFLEDWIT